MPIPSDPFSSMARPMPTAFQELLQGRDTLAGLASRYGLPVRTLLSWREQAPPAAARGGSRREDLLLGGAQPLQSRMAGPA